MDILKQRQWTKEELLAQGFRYYDRKKTVVLARELTSAEGTIQIKLEWDTLVAHPGYMICYDVSDGVVRANLDAYEHWPVEPSIFKQTYRKWDGDWTPTPPEKHLLDLGCKPYYKFAGLYAKKVTRPMYVQTLESIEPVEVPAGAYVTIGIKGEPTSMSAEAFYERYEPPAAPTPTLIERIVLWFRGES